MPLDKQQKIGRNRLDKHGGSRGITNNITGNGKIVQLSSFSFAHEFRAEHELAIWNATAR
jgi:hypothetical protein